MSTEQYHTYCINTIGKQPVYKYLNISSCFKFKTHLLTWLRNTNHLLFFTFQMRELQHDNINPFIGACIETPSPCVLFLYCQKGSLQVDETHIYYLVLLVAMLYLVHA